MENSQSEFFLARSRDKFSKIRPFAVDTQRDLITFELVEQICVENGEKYLQMEEPSGVPMASAVCDNLPSDQGMTIMKKGGEKL